MLNLLGVLSDRTLCKDRIPFKKRYLHAHGDWHVLLGTCWSSAVTFMYVTNFRSATRDIGPVSWSELYHFCRVIYFHSRRPSSHHFHSTNHCLLIRTHKTRTQRLTLHTMNVWSVRTRLAMMPSSLIYARCLGFLIIEAPDDAARDYISHEIMRCEGNGDQMDALAQFYITHLFRLSLLIILITALRLKTRVSSSRQQLIPLQLITALRNGQ